MNITAFQLAQRFVGLKEVAGAHSNPAVLAMLQLDTPSVQDDATAWCSSFCNYIAWLLNLPRSKSLAAKSWLEVGRPIQVSEAKPGYDIVILNRTDNPALGHVAFYAGVAQSFHGMAFSVTLLGGNQDDRVSYEAFPIAHIAGVRRLYEGE